MRSYIIILCYIRTYVYIIFIYNLCTNKIGFCNEIQLRFYFTDLWVVYSHAEAYFRSGKGYIFLEDGRKINLYTLLQYLHTIKWTKIAFMLELFSVNVICVVVMLKCCLYVCRFIRKTCFFFTGIEIVILI